MKYFLLGFIIFPIFLFSNPTPLKFYVVDKKNDPEFKGINNLYLGNLIHEDEKEVHLIIYNKENCIWIVKTSVK